MECARESNSINTERLKNPERETEEPQERLKNPEPSRARCQQSSSAQCGTAAESAAELTKAQTPHGGCLDLKTHDTACAHVRGHVQQREGLILKYQNCKTKLVRMFQMKTD